MNFLNAIARMEGWLNLESRCRRNNNPGNVEDGRFARSHGATGTDGRFAIFPTAEDGFAAMRGLFQAHSYMGMTVSQAIHRWAPSNENDTEHYIASVCMWAGCKPTDVIDDLVKL